MRLLHSRTYELREFVDNEANKMSYAILSHTWDLDEVTFQDVQSWMVRHTRKLGWKKIDYCCRQARQEGIDWIWMDTVCIDKSSSAELSEAINSMFIWYRDAKICYAYLADIPAAKWSAPDHYSCLKDSRWFSRGWTLQELLAPREMTLYGTDWNQLGTRHELSDLISQVSGIQVSALEGDEKQIGEFSIAQRMCWASRRETTRSEDIAYCLLGLFDVNMPLLYGEGGKKAFIRLQEEIMKNSDDHTLFAWGVPEGVESHKRAIKEVGLLAEHPIFFRSSKDVLPFRRWDVSDTFSMTNKGLRITLPLTAEIDYPGNWIGYLDCYQLKDDQQCAVGILLKELSEGGDQFARVAQATLDIPMSLEHEAAAEKRAIYIRKEIIKPDDAFKGDIHRPREFRLLQTPSTHQLVEKYGSASEGSNSQKLLAPPKTNSYWIDQHAWFNWHVVCLFEEKESVYRAQTSSFILVLGYDGNASKSWCAVEPFNHQSLRDVWDKVRCGKSDAANMVLWKGRSVLQVNIKPAVEDPGAIEVYVHFNYGLRDSSDHGTSRDMDPLSIFSGTDGVADICIHLVKYLEDTGLAISAFEIDLNKDAQSRLAVHESSFLAIDNRIRGFIKDLKALGAANKSIQTVYYKEIMKSCSSIPETFWKMTAKFLKNCHKAVEELKQLLEDIYCKAPSSSHDATLLFKSLNLEDKHSETKELKQSLDNVLIYHKILHMSLLTAVSYDDVEGNGETVRSLDALSREIETSQSQIATILDTSRQSKNGYISDSTHDMTTLTAISDFKTSVDAAIEAMYLETSNIHFYVPRVVSAIFTGRNDLLVRLKAVLFEASTTIQDNYQRRIVIYGTAGSGKTQFCCKFASENYHRYWGVFWIDLSSPEMASHTCAQIAKIGKVGGVKPTVDAAMDWLSILKRRYLLILDNADDPDLWLDNYFPRGNMAHVLVATRNPACRTYGNIGSLELRGLNFDDANSLMLKAADQPPPWDNHLVSKASKITEALGHNPLAIIHAGRAILNNLCTLDNYLDFYNRSMERVRAMEPSWYDHSYASFEILYSNLMSKDTPEARDAIQLLKTFAFFHAENIRFDILERAILNPAKEREQQEKDKEKYTTKNIGDKSRRLGWLRTLHHAIQVFLLADHTPLVLPDAIRDGQSLGHFDAVRLRSALKELLDISLIIHNGSGNSDSYSMHPLVHSWVRARPRMSLAEQALWSEAAATTLSASLLLPPLSSTPEEELFSTAVLPHIQHILAWQRSIHECISNSRRVNGGSLWSSFNRPYTLSRTRAITNMKFSLVLAHAGLFTDAERLQEQVKDYELKILGIEHDPA